MKSQDQNHGNLFPWNNTFTPFNKQLMLHNLVENTAWERANDMAVSFRDQSLDYNELNRQANKLAHYLLSLGVKPAAPVALMLDRSLEVAVTVLAILKAGGAYVPIDPFYPSKRQRYMLEDCGAVCLLTTSDLRSKLSFFKGEVVLLDKPERWADKEETNLDLDIGAKLPAYIMYTSGSTGEPKGTVMSHRAVSNLLQWQAKDVRLGKPARTLLFSPLGFDVSSQEIFSTWLVGGPLILVDEDTRHDPYSLNKFLEQKEIERLFLPYVALQMLASAVSYEGKAPGALRDIISAGEQLILTEEIRNYLASIPNCRLHNHYGSTEGHVVTAYTLPADISHWPEIAPIGRAIANTNIFLLDSEGAPTPLGEPGEIFIGGEGVADGYWKRPEITRERFVIAADGSGEILYRPGDFARSLPDGNLQFVGRTDTQIKIRGYRVELAEVEAVLRKHESVQEAIVTAVGEGSQMHLVAYIFPESDSSIDAQSVDAHMRRWVPRYMIPDAFVPIKEIPLTPSGKINHRALPEPPLFQPSRTQELVGPRSQEEEKLAEMWREILQVEAVGIYDDFFDLGGHSLSAMQVLNRFRLDFKIQCSFHDLFKEPTVAGMARLLTDGDKISSNNGSQLDKAAYDLHGLNGKVLGGNGQNGTEEGNLYPLSYQQESLWFLVRLYKGRQPHNIPELFRLKGPIDIDALRSAFAGLMERHEILRSNIHEESTSLRQVIQPSSSFSLPVHDLRYLKGKDQETAWQQMVIQEANKDFDLQTDLMLRANIYRIADDDYLLLLVLHHIASDGWSMVIVFQELGEFYAASVEDRLADLPPLPVQYKEYAIWQREQMQQPSMSNHLAFWKRYLEGVETLRLPTDRRAPEERRYTGGIIRFDVDSHVIQNLSDLASREQVTLFMILLTAYYILLQRYSGQDDIAVGVPVANRQDHNYEKLVGFFVDTQVMRVDLSGKPRFWELLMRVRDVVVEILDQWHLPHAHVVAAIKPERQLDQDPLSQFIFQTFSLPRNPPGLVDMDVERIDLDYGTSLSDLEFLIYTDGDPWKGYLRYSDELFDQSTVQGIVDHYLQLLKSIADNPNQVIGQISLLTAPEKHRLLNEWNKAAVAYPREQSIHGLFRNQTHVTPQATAVYFEGQYLTYLELNQRANQLANFLVEQGVQPGEIVGMSLERSLELVVAMLAILKAGGIYLPIDQNYPIERINWMIEDAKCRFLITNEKFEAELLNGGNVFRVLDIRQLATAIQRQSSEEQALDERRIATAAAYVMFTSGTSGRPKGVIVPHRAVIRLVKNSNYADFDADQRFVQFAPISFDASTLEIWGALLNGGKLFIYHPGLTSLAHLAQFLRRHQITYLFLTASLFQQMVDYEAETLAAIPRVQAGGDVVSPAHVRRLLEADGICNFAVVYGPTENTTYTTWYPVKSCKDINGRLPIGRPISNSTVYILDPDLQPVPVGVPGELCCGGDGLALGYLNRPRLTEAKFIRNPFSSDAGSRLYRTGDLARYLPDGNIEFLGRVDRQIKIRGFRIELDEIERQLATHEDILQAAIIVVENSDADKQIIAYVVPVPDRLVDEDKLRAHLTRYLPDHMLPTRILLLSSLPLDPNGKIDRNALPLQATDGTDDDQKITLPRTNEEKALADIWKEVLNLRYADIHTNFFDAGGHSLLGIRLFALIEKELGNRLPLSLLFQASTIAQLAPYLSEEREWPLNETLIPIQPSGKRPPFFCVHGFGGGVLGYADLAAALGSDQPFYGLQAAGFNGNQAPDTCIETMAANYVKVMQEVQPTGPYFIGGYCLGGVIAYEIAKQLESVGESAAVVAIIEGHAPNAQGDKGSLIDRQRFLTVWNNIPYWVQEYLDLGAVRLRRWFRVFLQTQKARLFKLIGRPLEQKLEDMVAIDLEGVPKHQRQLMLAHLKALSQYDAGLFNGRVTLFRAQQSTIRSAILGRMDSTNGWGALALGGVEVHQVSGAHHNVHMDPHVESLAEVLDGVIKRGSM